MRIAHILLRYIFIFSSYSSFAQKSEGLQYIENAEPRTFIFSDKQYYVPGKMPFGKIVVADYRFDTSKVGYITMGLGKSANKAIRPDKNWNSLLNHYFKAHLDPASPNTLFIVLRSFWMQEGILDEITSKKIIRKEWLNQRDMGVPGIKNQGGNCKAAIDIFVCSDSLYQPLFKLEETFLNFNAYRPGNLDQWFYLPFDSMARRIASMDISNELSRKKKIPATAIQQFYTERLQLPVLQTGTLIRGIYLSFDDFRQQKLYTADFRLQKGRTTDELYIVQNGNESLLTEFWGFSDGSQLYIKAGFNVFPALRRQNTFEVFGAKHISNVHNNASSGDLIRINSMEVERKILQLNMDTGVFY